jgi:penicillin G amidase
MRLLRRILRWILIALVLLLLIGGGGGYLWLRSALPQTTGTIQVPGISAQVEIIRDADAVPHIRAQTEADAFFGLGYAHSQDRLWQMEFQRRIGNARLSEIGGASTLETDKFLRTLGVARAATSAWERLSPAARKPIEAYVAGVNAFISTHSGRQLPIEFTILGIKSSHPATSRRFRVTNNRRWRAGCCRHYSRPKPTTVAPGMRLNC